MNLSVDITKQLPGFTVEVSFSCNAGQLLAIVGPSGSGKTTIIRMIAGLAQPDSGRIAHGARLWLDTGRRLQLPTRKRRLGYVFQEHPLFPHLSLEKNVAFAAADRCRVQEYFELFGIAHLRRRKPHQVSGGERQRAALAQALASDPGVLLLDEPFSALDVVTRRQLREELKAITERLHIPVIHVTHDLEEASFLADHLLPVAQGKIAHDWLRTADTCSGVSAPRSRLRSLVPAATFPQC